MKPFNEWKPVSMHLFTFYFFIAVSIMLGWLIHQPAQSLQDCFDEKLEWIHYADSLKTELEAGR